jgi:2-C-methyl-D-erythritol 4-phosphate cytidylyltransferase
MRSSQPKQFLEIAGAPILAHTLRAVSRVLFISGIFLVVPGDFAGPAERMAAPYLRSDLAFEVIVGGAERQDSVYNALRALPRECGWVVIHDGVRPFASPELFDATWKMAHETGAAIAALPSTDTVKRVDGSTVVETLPRQEIWLVQTPQIFRTDLILGAYERAREEGGAATDDASLVERTGAAVSVVRGEPTNIKVTTPEDLAWAEWFMNGRRTPSGAARPGKAGGNG